MEKKMVTLRKGDTGANVLVLQQLLNNYAAELTVDGWFGEKTEQAVRTAQQRFGLVVDGIAGPKTHQALRNAGRYPKALTDAALERAASRLNVPLATIRAVNEIESNGRGFIEHERVAILYERHVMYRRLIECYGSEFAQDAALRHPTVVNSKRGGYRGGAGEHTRLEQAMKIDRVCALESCSWGLFQIMGYHWRRLGYASVEAFVDDMSRNENEQLDAFVRFIETDAALQRALQQQQWEDFARRYNGPAYRDNLYDVKLERAHARYAAREICHV